MYVFKYEALKKRENVPTVGIIKINLKLILTIYILLSDEPSSTKTIFLIF